MHKPLTPNNTDPCPVETPLSTPPIEDAIERIREYVETNKRSRLVSTEDIVQEIIVELLEIHGQLDVDDEVLKRLLNKHRSRERRTIKKRPASLHRYIDREDDDEHPADHPGANDDEVTELVDDFCKTLPERLRPIASMMFTHSNVDIARRLRMAESNVSRDLKLLRKQFVEFQEARDHVEEMHRRKPRDGWNFDGDDD